MNDLYFNISISKEINGHELKEKTTEPDKDGFFPVVLMALNMPTRGGVIYDAQSTVACIKDETAKFNICLRDGNLPGEWGHPDCTKREDIPRLLTIKEDRMSHYFGGVWLDTNPIRAEGYETLLVRGKVKPYGPYGDVLEKALRDPSHNTAFSLRALCQPMAGPDNRFEYRKMQVLVTFDAVSSPGYAVASKRYAQPLAAVEAYQESVDIANDYKDYELLVDESMLTEVAYATPSSSMESSRVMLTKYDVNRIYDRNDILVKGAHVGRGTIGNNSILGTDQQVHSAVGSFYGWRN